MVNSHSYLTLTNQQKLTQSNISSSLKHSLHLASRSSHAISFALTHLMFLNVLILPHLPDTLKLPKDSVFIFPLNLYQLFRRSHPLQIFLYIIHVNEYQSYVYSMDLILELQFHVFNSQPRFAIWLLNTHLKFDMFRHIVLTMTKKFVSHLSSHNKPLKI